MSSTAEKDLELQLATPVLPTDSDPEAADVGVGSRVRALRDAMSLSLRDLAERCGVSAQMLSQVERGETSPTLAVAAKIAAGLELTLSQLLRLDEGQHVASPAPQSAADIVAAATGSRSSPRPYPVSAPMFPCTRSTPAPPPAVAADPPMHEPGSRETAVVLAGALALVLDGTRNELGAGDGVTFDADLPHHFENEGDEPTRFIAVIAAGLRRS